MKVIGIARAALVGATLVAGITGVLGPGAMPPPAAAQPAEDEETSLLIDEARRAIARRDYTRAGTLLDRAIQVNPRRLDAYIVRASLHGVLKQHDRAVAVMRRARTLAPTNSDVLTALGVQLVLAGNPGEGVPMLEVEVAKAPSRYGAQVVLGHYYVRTGRWKEAVTAFDAYFKYRPRGIAGEDQVHQIDQANAYLRSGQPAKARTIYQQIVDRNRRNELARLGVAWSTAVLDCGQAMQTLGNIADLEAKYAEVSIVRARCALTLGRLNDALDGADRYRERRPQDPRGWALLGDIRAGMGNLRAAEGAFNEALRREPDNALYSLKLARTERLLGKHATAIARLRKAGPPRDLEPMWTIELGEALLAAGEHAQLRDHMAPWVGTHPTDATARFLLGASLIGQNQAVPAIEHLEAALASKPPEERARGPLITALNVSAVAEVASNDIAGAESRLDRAEQLGDSVVTWRNLGAIRLKQGKTQAALAVLRKAADRDKRDARAAHLLARALHAAGQLDEARAQYRRALRMPGGDPVAVALDLAAAEYAAGHGDDAADVLNEALGSTTAESRGKVMRTYVDIARASSTDWMRTGQFARAVKVLRQLDAKLAETDAQAVAVRCDLALAATGAGQRDVALDYLRRLDKARSRCPFVAPADEVAVPILIAWNEGSQLRLATKSLDRLEKLRRQATGAAEPLARLAARDIALRAANEAYDRGRAVEAKKYLNEAEKYDRRNPELGHNLAVLDLAAGRVDVALVRLSQVQSEVPEALVNIGIAYDRKGEPLRALDYYRKAVAVGVRFAPLRSWIDMKERLWGSSAGGGSQ